MQLSIQNVVLDIVPWLMLYNKIFIANVIHFHHEIHFYVDWVKTIIQYLFGKAEIIMKLCLEHNLIN